MYFYQKNQGKGKLYAFLKMWFLNIGGSKFDIIAIWMKVALKAVLIKNEQRSQKLKYGGWECYLKGQQSERNKGEDKLGEGWKKTFWALQTEKQ